MTDFAEKLKEEVLQLPTQDRAELAYCLINSLDAEENNIQAAWEEELDRRCRDLENGKAVCQPIENVFAELRKKYP